MSDGLFYYDISLRRLVSDSLFQA